MPPVSRRRGPDSLIVFARPRPTPSVTTRLPRLRLRARLSLAAQPLPSPELLQQGAADVAARPRNSGEHGKERIRPVRDVAVEMIAGVEPSLNRDELVSR